MASATSSPFKKDHIRKNLAYYFDDERIAIVERNGTGTVAVSGKVYNQQLWQLMAID